MSEIKSEKVIAFIDDNLLMNRRTFAVADIEYCVVIAGQEAEERHAKEMKELTDRAVGAFCYSMQKGVSSCDRNKDKGCTMACRAYLNFTQKLTEK